jgi:ribosomal protein L11 methyltransferase
MPWLALTLELDAAAVEPFSDALLEAGADSVAIEEAETPSCRRRLTALLALNVPIETLLEKAAQTSGIAAPRYSTMRVEDQDWVRQSQAQFTPLSLDRLWVGPSWVEPPRTAKASIRLDPGLAFGTGSHPSTRLALKFLEQRVHGGERILDYGCGSGILAIAAAKLGARQVDAVDIDPQAVETACANAAANGVNLRSVLPEALASGRYDVVISNILAQPLMMLAPLLVARTEQGGWIALSGILSSQAAEVAAAYEGMVDIAVRASEDGWALLGGTRR